MIPEDLIFINAASHDDYFLWQEEVMIVNFLKHGIKNINILIWYPPGSQQLPKWDALQKKYPTVKFYFYQDQGVNLSLYIPQLRPHTLKQHFEKFREELKGKVFFYHDCDIIFNYLPDFQSLVEGDVCWESDTSSYLDYDYLRRKEIEGNIPENEAISVLAKIGNVSVETIKSYTGKTGGCQTILKGIDSEFWQDIENQVIEIRKAFFWGDHVNSPNVDSVNYKYFTKPGRTAKQNEDAGFQSWCADMWALNFALWSRGIPTDITPKLDFSWATNDAVTYSLKPIYHNAGVTSNLQGLFYKAAWIGKSPIGQNIPYPPKNSANWHYVKAIHEVNV